jgi:hypothetical protein
MSPPSFRSSSSTFLASSAKGLIFSSMYARTRPTMVCTVPLAMPAMALPIVISKRWHAATISCSAFGFVAVARSETELPGASSCGSLVATTLSSSRM